MFCEGQNVVFEKVKCVISTSSKINLNMQGKTSKSCDLLELEVTFFLKRAQNKIDV